VIHGERLREDDGECFYLKRVANEPEAIIEAFAQLPAPRCGALESGTNALLRYVAVLFARNVTRKGRPCDRAVYRIAGPPISAINNIRPPQGEPLERIFVTTFRQAGQLHMFLFFTEG